MDLQKSLAAEHSKKQCDRIVKYIGDNTLRLLQDTPIPKKYHGRVMSLCFDLIQSHDTPIAVKAFSLTVLHQLSKEYPDIAAELRLIIEEQWEQATPAIRSRARKILKGMNSTN